MTCLLVDCWGLTSQSAQYVTVAKQIFDNLLPKWGPFCTIHVPWVEAVSAWPTSLPRL